MKPTLLHRAIFLQAPHPGVAVHAITFRTSHQPRTLASLHATMSRSDTYDVAHVRYSQDNGRSWSPPETYHTRVVSDCGILRTHPRGGIVHPHSGALISFATTGNFARDHAHEGLTRYRVTFNVSHDGNLPLQPGEPIVAAGHEFDPMHPLPGVFIGRNSFMIGDFATQPLINGNDLLLPVQITPLDEKSGHIYDPHQVGKYRVTMLLRGRLRADHKIRWEPSQVIRLSPDESTRGAFEPTIAKLAGDQILMVMRGSNAKAPAMPGYRWFSISRDGGQSWPAPRPWTFTSGLPFHSPSSCSQLLSHSSGRIYWLGNIATANPQGNSPRYPLEIVEVDPASGLLIESTRSVIDDREADESPHLTLSNFLAREDPETGHLLLHMSRLFARDFRRNGTIDWTADALQYRIELPG